MFDNGRGYYVFEKKNDEEATIFFRYKFEGVSDESKISFTLMEVDIIDDKGKEIDTSYFYKIDNSELLVIKGKKYNGYRNNDVVKLKAFAMYHDSNYEEIELIRIERKEDYNRLIPLFPER